jgi:hypothetical protein
MGADPTLPDRPETATPDQYRLYLHGYAGVAPTGEYGGDELALLVLAARQRATGETPTRPDDVLRAARAIISPAAFVFV